MNRRGFIGTLTALAGVVLATRSPSSHKIKAPATLSSGDHLAFYGTGTFRPGIATLAPQEPITAKWFRYPNKCPFCGNQGMSGYDTICLCQPLKDAIDRQAKLA